LNILLLCGKLILENFICSKNKNEVTIISSRESLYLETGWEPLAERQKVAELNTISEIHNNSVPVYLKKGYPSISPTRMFESNYNTRSRNYTTPRCRFQLFKKAFVYDTINNETVLISRPETLHLLIVSRTMQEIFLHY
jgi:hypothetical protein